MSKKSNRIKSLTQPFLIVILFVSIFVCSFFGSFLTFSSNHSFGMRNLRDKVVKSGEEELVLSTKTEYDKEFWDILFEDNTSALPFINCASRFSEQTLSDGRTITLFDVPAGNKSDNNYSFNHVYGYNNVWMVFKNSTAIVSYDFDSLYHGKDSLEIINVSDELISLPIIGKCDGRSSNNRANLGNVLADEFGLFAFITQSDMDNLKISGYLKVISVTQGARSFNLEVEKWISNSRMPLSKTSFSSKMVQNEFSFYEYTMSKRILILPGVVLISFSSILSIFCYLLTKKYFHKKGIKIKTCVLALFLLSWIILSVIFSNIQLELGGLSIFILDTGAMVFPTAFCLVLVLNCFLRIIPWLDRIEEPVGNPFSLKPIYFKEINI